MWGCKYQVAIIRLQIKCTELQVSKKYKVADKARESTLILFSRGWQICMYQKLYDIVDSNGGRLWTPNVRNPSNICKLWSNKIVNLVLKSIQTNLSKLLFRNLFMECHDYNLQRKWTIFSKEQQVFSHGSVQGLVVHISYNLSPNWVVI